MNNRANLHRLLEDSYQLDTTNSESIYKFDDIKFFKDFHHLLSH